MRSILTNFAFLSLLLASPMAVAWTLQGQVVAIVNGDTIRVRDERKVQHTVRLAGIDAPEKFQKHAQRSEDTLREFVFQKYVTVEVPRQGGSPRLGKVVVAGRDVSLELLADGAAWYAPSRAQDLAEQDRQAYAAAEADARQRRAGLWRDSKPIPPWEYRAGRRK
jgi:endonuclease YncB( thermonuclease family)